MTDSETEDDGWEQGSRDEEQSEDGTCQTHFTFSREERRGHILDTHAQRAKPTYGPPREQDV
jgi:hypothetical protein